MQVSELRSLRVRIILLMCNGPIVSLSSMAYRSWSCVSFHGGVRSIVSLFFVCSDSFQLSPHRGFFYTFRRRIH